MCSYPVVLLSDVLLSGFTTCTKHSTKIRGMGIMCSYPICAVIRCALIRFRLYLISANFFRPPHFRPTWALNPELPKHLCSSFSRKTSLNNFISATHNEFIHRWIAWIALLVRGTKVKKNFWYATNLSTLIVVVHFKSRVPYAAFSPLKYRHDAKPLCRPSPYILVHW